MEIVTPNIRITLHLKIYILSLNKALIIREWKVVNPFDIGKSKSLRGTHLTHENFGFNKKNDDILSLIVPILSN